MRQAEIVPTDQILVCRRVETFELSPLRFEPACGSEVPPSFKPVRLSPLKWTEGLPVAQETLSGMHSQWLNRIWFDPESFASGCSAEVRCRKDEALIQRRRGSQMEASTLELKGSGSVAGSVCKYIFCHVRWQGFEGESLAAAYVIISQVRRK